MNHISVDTTPKHTQHLDGGGAAHASTHHLVDIKSFREGDK